MSKDTNVLSSVVPLGRLEPSYQYKDTASCSRMSDQKGANVCYNIFLCLTTNQDGSTRQPKFGDLLLSLPLAASSGVEELSIQDLQG